MKVRRSKLTLLITLAVLLTGTTPEVAGSCGDINNDGFVADIADLTYLIKYMFKGGPPPPQMSSVDVNGDRGIDIADLTYLITYMFKGGSALACPFGTVTDIDGNVYQTIKIGDQWWMAENLKVTHYRNGDAIPNVTGNAAWTGLTSGAYCNYDNNVDNAATYGRLYNLYAVIDGRSIAPAGWHVPTDDDWKQLETHLGLSQAEADAWGLRGSDEGGKLKEAGTTHWDSPNTGATNESGFTALPGGFRDFFDGDFSPLGFYTIFGSSTESVPNVEVWTRDLSSGNSGIYRHEYFLVLGVSVRCVRD